MKLKTIKLITAKGLNSICKKYGFADLADDNEYHQIILQNDCLPASDKNVLYVANKIAEYTTFTFHRLRSNYPREERNAARRKGYNQLVEKIAFYILAEGLFIQTDVIERD